MLLWVGLGNPEPSQARHRHNIGFLALDAITCQYQFSPWKKKYKGEIAEGNISGQRILALKPLTYMNASGESVQAAASYTKVAVSTVWVFHDELDLAPGKVRVKKGGGTAGHNGLRDIQRALGTPEFWRVRLGIGHPGHKDRVHAHVLSSFSKEEQAWLLPFLEEVAKAAPLLAQAKPEEFMTRMALMNVG